MPILIEEYHVTLYAPRRLPDRDYLAMRRVLNSDRFRRALQNEHCWTGFGSRSHAEQVKEEEMKSRPLATKTAAIVVVVFLATAISHDAWLFLVPMTAALVVAGVVARSVSNQRKR